MMSTAASGLRPASDLEETTPFRRQASEKDRSIDVKEKADGGAYSPLRDCAETPRFVSSTPGSDWLPHPVVRFRSFLLVSAHGAIFSSVYALAYLVRFDGAVPPRAAELALATLPLVVGLKLVVFLGMGSHRGWWRYATFVDVICIAEAATVGTASLVVVNYLCSSWFLIPRSIILLDWGGTLLLICGLRGSTRLFRERYYPMIADRSPDRVFLVGASEESVAIAHSIQSRPDLPMRVDGFLDSNRSLHGRVLSGVKVVGSPDQVQALARRRLVTTVLIPTPTVPPSEVRDLVALCNLAKLKVKVVPVLNALLDGTLTVRPRDVDIHDLLGREPVELDTAMVRRFLRAQVVMVTGAAGSIGSEICRQSLVFRPEKLILLDHSENGLFHVDRELQPLAGDTEIVTFVASITDGPRLRSALERHRPAVVFHAAAHKHVPMMEANPGEAVKNNVFGTRTLADEVVRAGVEAFVMISTDKAVNPTSVMGACKRLAEKYVHALSGRTATRMVTVRFGNVLGSNGSVVPLFQEQVRKGGPVTVTHPAMTRYFMTIPEATQLVLQAGALGQGGEIFVLDMGEPVKVVDLARDLIRLSGFTEGREIQIVFTGPRPGEKLFEELYDAREERLPTPHPKIFRAKHRADSMDMLLEQLDSLAQVVNEQQEPRVIDALERILPEYKPEHSKADTVEDPCPASVAETDYEALFQTAVPANS